ncbi:MAG: hypothetical protein FJX80_00165 [Bacteroidetes bacterium]|nr:hypothetical protein [Bacteroidota bacterium]
MNRTLLFSSPNVESIYKLYEILSAEFLKRFKFSAEFRITTESSSRSFSLAVEDVAKEQAKWLQDRAIQTFEKNFQKVVDER